MCGIIGFCHKNLNKEKLVLGTNSISHRGPDSEGIFYEDLDSVGLGHRRLSILDLSEKGNQPYSSICGRYVMVYNGEVYNFKELAKKYNVRNRSATDTEIILELYALNGANCFNELNGMFALVIWDKQDKKLTLARDRMGIKPLFYFVDKGNLVFCSEIKGIVNCLDQQLAIDKEAVAFYLHLGYIPEPKTIYKRIKKFPSGHYATFKEDQLSINKYWEIENHLTSKVISNEAHAEKNLEELLFSSVEYRMISDVPLGTFLSGGIDSSLITALAQKCSTKPIKTFSIGFENTKFNELKYANSIAKFLKTDHHPFILKEKDALEKVANLIDIYDEPIADSSTIPTLLVSEMARKKVTVALSGDGGDELFLGYGMYDWAKRLRNPFFYHLRQPISQLLKKTGTNRNIRASKVFELPGRKQLKSHVFSQEQYLFTKQEIKRLLKGYQPFHIDETIRSPRLLSPEEEQSLFDMKYYLKDDLLVKVDRASMKHSLEVRVPLLDHRIVEFAANLSPDLKKSGNVKKYLLKKILYKFIPKSYFERPKWGFGIPLHDWLRNDLRYLIDEYLSKEIIESQGIFEFSFIEKLKVDFFDRKLDYLANRIWSLILLSRFVQKLELDNISKISSNARSEN